MTMSIALLLALVCLVFAMVLDAREHLLLALLGWFGCAWITISAVLLAIYDLLAVRREELERQIAAAKIEREKD